MAKIFLSAAKLKWEIRFQYYVMPGLNLFKQVPDDLMSYQPIHVFVSVLGSVLWVFLGDQYILLILFLREQINFDTMIVAVLYKGK